MSIEKEVYEACCQKKKVFFNCIFFCFCLYHRLFTSRLSITPDFVEFITDLFAIVSDFIMGYPGPDRDCLEADLTYLRFYCHDPVDRSVKLIYQKLFVKYDCYQICRKYNILYCIINNWNRNDKVEVRFEYSG